MSDTNPASERQEWDACPFCGDDGEKEVNGLIHCGVRANDWVRCLLCNATARWVMWNRRQPAPTCAAAEMAARIAELEEEVAVDDKLLAEQYTLMDLIPPCPIHGNRCTAHARDWLRGKVISDLESNTSLERVQKSPESAHEAIRAQTILEMADFCEYFSDDAHAVGQAIRALVKGQG